MAGGFTAGLPPSIVSLSAIPHIKVVEHGARHSSSIAPSSVILRHLMEESDSVNHLPKQRTASFISIWPERTLTMATAKNISAIAARRRCQPAVKETSPMLRHL